MRANVRVASANDGLAARGEDASMLGRPRGPVVRFLAGMAAPAVERIVDKHAFFQLSAIIGLNGRKPERDGQQPRRLRLEVKSCGVGPANDACEVVKSRVGN